MIDTFAKKWIFELLQNLQTGSIKIVDKQGVHVFGQIDYTTPDLSLHDRCEITVHNPQFYRKLILHGSLGAAESYIDGDWDVDNLTALISIIIQNKKISGKIDTSLSVIRVFLGKIKHYLRRNTVAGSKKNIIAHYDLGNDFFKLFLDPHLMYSSAIYPDESVALEQAAIHKLQRICEKLNIKASDHILEIGTGWGGFALYAAQNFGCNVTTTTISEEQYKFASDRIEKAGLSNKITILNKDYRELAGQYDKIVSIEMLEAVGHQYFASYFKQCDKLLVPGGTALIQVITIMDQEYERAKYEADFIKYYIFPGGCLPSLTVICDTLTRYTQLRIIQAEDIGLHYAKTLAEWRQRFSEKTDEIHRLGFNEYFIRMWHYYFCYCEAGFLQQYISDFQLIIKK